MRLFLAIDLPAPTRARLGQLQQSLAASCPGFRWVRPHSIHLTLRFLGEVSVAIDESARPAWAEVAAAGTRFAVRPQGLGVFPAGGRPRVLWVGLHELGPGEPLVGLARAVELAARRVGFPPAEPTFRPHLTIARAVRGARPLAPADLGWRDPQPFEALELTLFQSALHPAGARYTALARFPLGTASGEA